MTIWFIIGLGQKRKRLWSAGVDYTARIVIAASNEPFDKGTWIYQSGAGEF